ncbi:MAG: hypothetical protein PHU25_17240 [Deltaproteobacteria bacterium]|nr:hypothetical protein [Deltaproteobacteria bacterium]
MTAHERRRLIETIRGAITQALGHRYQIALDALDTASLRELGRLLRDLDEEQREALRRVRREPWR